MKIMFDLFATVKKGIAFVLCLSCLLLSPSIYTFANSFANETPYKLVSEMDADEKALIVDQMKMIGLTDEQIEYVIQKEKENALSGKMSRWAFPPNPQEGDTYERNFYVSKGTMIAAGTSAANIAVALVNAGVAAVVAVNAASTVAALIADNVAFQGIDFTTHYVYGETNEGGLGWNTGATTWEIRY